MIYKCHFQLMLLETSQQIPPFSIQPILTHEQDSDKINKN
jgi:hypothetical protein